MKYLVITCLLGLGLAGSSWGQSRIYRCGNEYTNLAPTDPTRDCTVIDSGSVTTVPGTRPAAQAPTAPRTVSSAVSAPALASSLAVARTSPSEQKARDADARLILETELKKAQAQQAQWLKDYNNGEPEKIAGEARNYQKYLDRVAEMKANLARNERDMESLRRELARMAVPALAASATSAPAAK